MILCKYTKLDRAVYLGHLDVLKMFGMAIRRTAIPVAYSMGFNKHILLYMSQPLSLGLASECEYFCIDSPCDPDEFAEKMNSSLPEGIRLTKAFFVQKNPNIAGLMCAADYTAEFADRNYDPDDILKITEKPAIEMEIVSKGVKKIKDIKPLIYDISIENNFLKFCLACGNSNLKADRFISYITETTGIRFSGFITKKHLYTAVNGKLTDIDDYLGK